ncbi:MAG: ABC transporter permease, partial [Bryobacteraceae bacterium]
MFRYLPLILRNCRRNRRRALLTVASVAVSLSLLGVLGAVYHAFYFSDPYPEQALRLATRNRVSLIFPMPEAYGVKIRSIPGVREVMIENWFGGVYKDDRPENLFARFAIDPEKIFTVRPEMRLPEDQKIAFQRDRAGCLIGKTIAEKHGLRLGDRIPIRGDIYPINLELAVRGIFDTPDSNEVLYFHRKYLEESIGESMRGNAGKFTVLVESAEAVPRVGREIDEAFRNSTAQTKTEPERVYQLGFVNMMGNVKAFLLSLCAAVAFTILLVTANTMAMSARERTREVGVLKTLGFGKPAIVGLIAGEGLILALAGGVAGLGLAALLVTGVRRMPSMIAQLASLAIPAPVIATCLGVAALVGLVSAA